MTNCVSSGGPNQCTGLVSLLGQQSFLAGSTICAFSVCFSRVLSQVGMHITAFLLVFWLHKAFWSTSQKPLSVVKEITDMPNFRVSGMDPYQ